MEKAIRIAGKIAQRLEESIARDKLRLTWNIKKNFKTEGFLLKYAGREFHLEAECAPSAIFGLQQLQQGLASGHWEMSGEWRPRFALRPLWVGSEQEIALSPGVSVFAPIELCQAAEGDEVKFEKFCKRILGLGYNAIILGRWSASHSESPKPSSIIKTICSTLHEYGLKVIIKPQLTYPYPNRCLLENTYKDFLQHSLKLLNQQIPHCDALFWESECWTPDCQEHPLAREITQADLVRDEITLLQNVLENRTLIYFVPAINSEIALEQSKWLPSICDDMGNKSILAFPAVSGEFFADHLPPHPLWNALRSSPDISSTPLMPIVNLGSVNQGEGLWPSINIELIERYISGCHRHFFAGVIVATNRISTKGTFLDCNLWLASQAMWTNRSVSSLLESWFLAERKDLEFMTLSEAIIDLRSLTLKLSRLRAIEEDSQLMTQEECRAIVDSILPKLKELQLLLEKKGNKKTDRPTLYDYYLPFVKDARLITLRALQNMHLPLLHMKKEEDGQGGFWVQGLGGKMGKFLDQPQKGSAGSIMEAILNEN
jgi:hypothetical protein